MFNLKKKVARTMDALTDTIAAPATAEVIQRELVDTQARLMQEVKEILAAKPPKDEIAGRLKAIGFVGTKAVQTERKNEAAAAKAQWKADVAAEHARDYPGLKFIFNDTMQAICKKHGLVIGGVDRFTGEVPAWALKVMEENPAITHEYRIFQTGRRQWFMQDVYNDQIVDRVRTDKRLRIRGSASASPNGWNMDGVTVWSTQDEAVAKEYRVTSKTPALSIAAPVGEMELSPGERVEGHRIMEARDPIVCLEVKGGWVVLCAWGEEGQDPRVFNTGNN